VAIHGLRYGHAVTTPRESTSHASGISPHAGLAHRTPYKESSMKRFGLILAASAVIALGAGGAALAADHSGDHSHKQLALGFHSVEAPVGLRWWFPSRKVALDLGFGFASEPAFVDPNESEKSFAVEAGLPVAAYSWNRAHALFRPGILYQRDQIGFDADGGTPGVQYDTENQTTLDVMLECEAEVFLVENISVSAAHGIGFRKFDPGFVADSETSFGTRGNNFTTIGFHVYMK
jgi:hypothetical protein